MTREKTVDNLKVKIYKDRTVMGAEAARIASETIRNLLAKKEYVNIIFAAAPSQDDLITALIQEPGLDWGHVNAFHMDEYVGLDDDAPQRFGNYLNSRIFDKVSFNTVNYLNGSASNLEEECRRYTELLREFAPDIVFMGIGENTHIAFNDPHVADFNDPHLVKVVDLDEKCQQQQVNDGCFNRREEVPTHALTLTVPALLQADYIYCVVPGSTKAQAVYNTLNGEISEDFPSTALRKHHNSMLFLDDKSSALLT